MRRAPLILVLLAPSLAAQGRPAADSAAVARQQMRAATQALEAGDSTGALAAVQRAASAWPAQPAYVRAFARVAARLGRPEMAIAALDRVTALGASWDPADPWFAALAGSDAFRAAAARMTAATVPMTRSGVAWALGDTTLHPEGVAIDPATGRWFVGSIAQRRVVVRTADGRVRDFIAPGAGGLDGAFGLAVDARRGLLWVASAAVPEMAGFQPAMAGRSALLGYDLATGAFRLRVELPPSDGGHQLGDVIITGRGTLFATDSRAPVVYRVDAGPPPAVASVVAEGQPLFRSLQGMVPDRDERALYVADYSHGLLRLDLTSGAAERVAPPAGGTLVGIDGMTDDGEGGLVAVQNGIAPVRVIRLRLDRTGTAVTELQVLDRPDFGAGEATLGVRAGRSFVYVATSPPMLRSLDLDRR